VVATFLALLPFALAAAISPMMLAEQTLLLSTPGGRRAGRHFALGVGLVLLAVVVLLIAFGRAISLPKEPKLSSGLDIAIGAGLLLVAFILWRRKRRGEQAPEEKEEQKSSWLRFAARGAFPFGIFSMATNFTTLALIIPAAKEISASDTSFPERLDAVDRFIKDHGRQATLALLFALGLFLVARGLTHLL
jgi:threonine/homoserine/homoserine lactone efflux protein